MIDGNYVWELNPPVIPSFSAENLHPVILKLLKSRGIDRKEDVVRFLRASLEDMYNPMLLKDMDKAVQRVKKGLAAGEKITVYGDYDVDGITGCCLMVRALREMGGNVDFYIPSRLDEGYGLNKEALEKIAREGTTLIITVDNGIASHDEVRYAKELGVDVIITDHHEPHEVVPDAAAVINPKQKDCPYPFKNLAGVGVAFKFIQALAGSDDEILLKYLDLAALGTIADMVPLVDENRIIAKHGLNALKNTDKPGLSALMSQSRLDDAELNAEKISYILAPRLNAAGRLSDATTAVQLLLTDDTEEARELAMALEDLNRERQALENKIYNEVREYVEKNIDLENVRVIVASSSRWHPGVIGIVASKLVQCYCMPCILIAEEGEEGKGSARSIPGFNIFEALDKLSYMLDKFGGHDQAAGFTIKVREIGTFRSKINELAREISREKWDIRLNIDLELKSEDINMELAEQLKILEPFGFGNPKPLFICKNLSVERVRAVGEGEKHLKIFLKKRRKEFSAIGFNLGAYKDKLEMAPFIDAAFYLELNEWEGVREPQLNLKDIKVPYLRDELMIKLEEEYYKRFFNKSAMFAESLCSPPDKVAGQKDNARMLKLVKAKDKRQYVKDLIESDKRAMVKVNTPYQAWRLLVYLKRFDHIKSNLGVFFNWDEADIKNKKNIILINPQAVFHRQALDFVDEIVFYDTPFSVELMEAHIFNTSSLRAHLIFNRDDLRYNYMVCEKLLPHKDLFTAVFEFLYRTLGKGPARFRLKDIGGFLGKPDFRKVNYIGIINVLNIFEELGILKYTLEGDTVHIIQFNGHVKGLSCRVSPTYQMLSNLRAKVIEFYNNFYKIQEILKQEEI
ncbi:single-stranded-DNA-specific exonuclease RecJ [Thermosediminibacter oceani]|uniref:Single-stranded-DNA-specific exonuclease RecJ n=1 Tax=Thermosediminibacter oceani (strain ATCC BAA-1034 / DSM 16646 / JW/IW-1228P) TaxID=555079 RepID=D9RXP7_THEOJ|nr:single-stranded-DNA-specific exonuclease RecJ [Thermosediminibacter oceani]ADL08121.1 single-stranded-DNA-specific exonuclease RecJ [Thermosediminibacter oceani DSM 16646]